MLGFACVRSCVRAFVHSDLCVCLPKGAAAKAVRVRCDSILNERFCGGQHGPCARGNGVTRNLHLHVIIAGRGLQVGAGASNPAIVQFTGVVGGCGLITAWLRGCHSVGRQSVCVCVCVACVRVRACVHACLCHTIQFVRFCNLISWHCVLLYIVGLVAACLHVPFYQTMATVYACARLPGRAYDARAPNVRNGFSTQCVACVCCDSANVFAIYWWALACTIADMRGVINNMDMRFEQCVWQYCMC